MLYVMYLLYNISSMAYRWMDSRLWLIVRFAFLFYLLCISISLFFFVMNNILLSSLDRNAVDSDSSIFNNKQSLSFLYAFHFLCTLGFSISLYSFKIELRNRFIASSSLILETAIGSANDTFPLVFFFHFQTIQDQAFLVVLLLIYSLPLHLPDLSTRILLFFFLHRSHVLQCAIVYFSHWC